MNSEELKKTYSTYPTKKLLDIVDNKFDYTELAVAVALAELSNRQVSEQDIKDYKEELIEETVIFIKRNISDDLTLLQKNLFYFIWLPFVNFPFKQNYRDDGYILKLKQADYYSLIGFVFFVIAGTVSANYNFSNLESVAIWIIGFLPAYAFDETFNRLRQIRRLQALYENSAPKAKTQTETETEIQKTERNDIF